MMMMKKDMLWSPQFIYSLYMNKLRFMPQSILQPYSGNTYIKSQRNLKASQ